MNWPDDFLGHVVEGDTLDVLKHIPAASVDLVVADPPYMISVASSGGGKLNPWADLMNAARWYRDLYADVRRILKPSGCFWTFLNWQTTPTIHRAAYDSGWKITSCLVWNKKTIGPGQRGLRPSHELVALLCGDDFSIEDRGVPDVLDFPTSTHKENGHPAEKPVNLVHWLLTTSGARAGQTFLDPFAGCGTGLAAAQKLGLRWAGIEIDEGWATYARERLKRATAQETLL